MLKSPNVSWPVKAKCFSKGPSMSATYDSAMWTIHEDMMKKTKAWENDAMRNILRLRWKKKVESYPQYMERSSRLAAGRFAEWKIAQTFHKIIKGIYISGGTSNITFSGGSRNIHLELSRCIAGA